MPCTREEVPPEHADRISELFRQVTKLRQPGTGGEDAPGTFARIRSEARELDVPDLAAFTLVVEAMRSFLESDYDATLSLFARYTTLLGQSGEYVSDRTADMGAMVASGVFATLADNPATPRSEIETFIAQAQAGGTKSRKHAIGAALISLLWAVQSASNAEVLAETKAFIELLHADDADYAPMMIAAARAAATADPTYALELLDGLVNEDSPSDHIVGAEVTRASVLRQLGKPEEGVQVLQQLIADQGEYWVVEDGDNATLLFISEADPKLADRLFSSIRNTDDKHSLHEGELPLAMARYHLLRDPESEEGKKLLAEAREIAAALDTRNGTTVQTEAFTEMIADLPSVS